MADSSLSLFFSGAPAPVLLSLSTFFLPLFSAASSRLLGSLVLSKWKLAPHSARPSQIRHCDCNSLSV